MKYELKGHSKFGEPYQKDASTTAQDVTVFSGIVGQPYDGFQNRDMFTAEYPFKGPNQDEIDKEIAAQAAAFVASKYPNF